MKNKKRIQKLKAQVEKLEGQLEGLGVLPKRRLYSSEISSVDLWDLQARVKALEDKAPKTSVEDVLHSLLRKGKTAKNRKGHA